MLCAMDELDGITELLNAAHAGDVAAQDRVYALVYDELKRCARRQRGVAPGMSLTPTGLVNELFLRLTSQGNTRIQNRVHFFSLAARAMRQIVVDHARRRASVKRGGGVAAVDVDEALDLSDRSAEEALELDDALNKLNAKDAQLARIVEWHFFGGLSFREIGEELGRHERTVFHDWELARAVLQESMRGERAP